MAKINWSLDPAHSELGFRTKHMMITNVKGRFDKYDVNVETEDNDFTTADITVKIDAASVNTGVEQRDGHLRSADFFEAEKYPYLTFHSTRLEKKNDENYVLAGDFTIKDVTHEVKLNVEYGGIIKDPWGNTKAGFTLSGKISRKEWGLVWNAALETGGFLVGDDINLNIDLELAKPAA